MLNSDDEPKNLNKNKRNDNKHINFKKTKQTLKKSTDGEKTMTSLLGVSNARLKSKALEGSGPQA
jgi:hypothetical protein